MKTKEEIKSTIEHGTVYTSNEFLELVTAGYIIDYDGSGRFHDGEKVTTISVWDRRYNLADQCRKYPYVIWYNK